MISTSKFFLSCAGAATLITVPMPVSAAIPAGNISAGDEYSLSDAQASDYYRRRHRHYRHRNRIDGGDILTGIAIIAGIAVIADAVESKPRRDRNDAPPPRDYDDNRANDTEDSDDVGAAVTACSNAAERSAGNGLRVSEIRNVNRDGAGWRVDGALGGSSPRNFSCATSNGRIEYIRLDDRDI